LPGRIWNPKGLSTWIGMSKVTPASIPVMRLDEFIGNYSRHPEAKAAGPDGMPAGPETRGVLGRLNLADGQPRRTGKEVDRLDEGEYFTLGNMDPAEYAARDHTLEWALAILAGESSAKLASLIGMSERRFRDIGAVWSNGFAWNIEKRSSD